MGQVTKIVGEELVPRKMVVVETTCDWCGKKEEDNRIDDGAGVQVDLIKVEVIIETGGHGSTYHKAYSCEECWMGKVSLGLEAAGFAGKTEGINMLSEDGPIKPYEDDE